LHFVGRPYGRATLSAKQARVAGDLQISLHNLRQAMAHFALTIPVMTAVLLLCQAVPAAGADYERAHPPRMLAASAQATAFYVEFRAREEAGGYGHSYVTLGEIDTSGGTRQTIVAGFLPDGADSDRWSKVGLPVAGTVGVTRSDIAGRHHARFRVSISRAQYFHVVRAIHRLRRTWTRYELLLRNCNGFVSQIAGSVGLRTPMVTAQYPVRYVAELRSLNSR
jgi:hypothetical protein